MESHQQGANLARPTNEQCNEPAMLSKGNDAQGTLIDNRATRSMHHWAEELIKMFFATVWPQQAAEVL